MVHLYDFYASGIEGKDEKGKEMKIELFLLQYPNNKLNKSCYDNFFKKYVYITGENIC